MLQLPSNSARNLHGNSAASAGGRASAAHPGGDTRGQTSPARPPHPVPATPPRAGHPAPPRAPPGGTGSREARRARGCSPHRLRGEVPLLRRVAAQGHAPGTAWQWTARLLLWNNTARQRGGRRLSKHCSHTPNTRSRSSPSPQQSLGNP